jgi:hypothetical protein
MDSIPNNLKPEIKEETKEEKIDIENHFHPIISSCEEDQLTRSVCQISFILKIKHVFRRTSGEPGVLYFTELIGWTYATFFLSKSWKFFDIKNIMELLSRIY